MIQEFVHREPHWDHTGFGTRIYDAKWKGHVQKACLDREYGGRVPFGVQRCRTTCPALFWKGCWLGTNLTTECGCPGLLSNCSQRPRVCSTCSNAQLTPSAHRTFSQPHVVTAQHSSLSVSNYPFCASWPPLHPSLQILNIFSCFLWHCWPRTWWSIDCNIPIPKYLSIKHKQ